MAVNKKGYFFTLTVLLLIILVSAALFAMRNPGHSREATIDNARISEIGSFVESIEKDAYTALKIASHRAFIALDDQIRLTNDYIPSSEFDLFIEELILNGTLNTNPIEILEISSMSEWIDKTNVLAELLRINFSLINQQITVTQSDAWFVDITFSADLQVTDNLTRATWDQPLVAEARLPITHFFDPVYAVGTDQRYFQRISNSSHTNFPTDIMDHITSKGYIATDNSPSFLQRLQGELHPDPLGIESLVDVNELSAVGINNQKTIVDWLYFDDIVYLECQVPGEPEWVVLDSNHASNYNVACP